MPDAKDWVLVQDVPEDAAELPDFLKKTLSDDCDFYRRLLGLSDAAPLVRVDAYVHGLGNGPYSTLDAEDLHNFFEWWRQRGERLDPACHVVPFDNDPRLAALALARWTNEQLRDSGLPIIPLPLPLDVSPTDLRERDEIQAILRRLRRGAEDVRSLVRGKDRTRAGDDEMEVIPQEALRNLVLFHSKRLVFLAYDQPSSRRKSPDDRGGRQKAVFDTIRRRAPHARVIVFASDEHHACGLERMGLLDREKGRRPVPV
jgi:hypothetical protein